MYLFWGKYRFNTVNQLVGLIVSSLLLSTSQLTKAMDLIYRGIGRP